MARQPPPSNWIKKINFDAAIKEVYRQGYCGLVIRDHVIHVQVRIVEGTTNPLILEVYALWEAIRLAQNHSHQIGSKS